LAPCPIPSWPADWGAPVVPSNSSVIGRASQVLSAGRACKQVAHLLGAGSVGVVRVVADQPHPGPPLRGEGEDLRSAEARRERAKMSRGRIPRAPVGWKPTLERDLRSARWAKPGAFGPLRVVARGGPPAVSRIAGLCPGLPSSGAFSAVERQGHLALGMALVGTLRDVEVAKTLCSVR